MATNKSIKKHGRKSQNALVIKTLANKHDLTTVGVYQMVRGDSQSELAQQILKEYRIMMQQITKVIEK